MAKAVEESAVVQHDGRHARERSEAGKEAVRLAQTGQEIGAADQIVGMALLGQDQVAEARVFFLKSLDRSRSLVSANPNSFNDLRDLGASLNSFGDVEAAAGNVEEAERAYRESVKVREELFSRYKNRQGAYKDLAVSLSRFGLFILKNKNDVLNARAYLGRSLTIFDRLSQMNPANLDEKFEVMIALTECSAVERIAEDLPKERDYVTKAVNIGKQLREADPTNFRYTSNYVSAAYHLAVVEMKDSQFEKAVDVYKVVVEISKISKSRWNKQFVFFYNEIYALQSLAYTYRILKNVALSDSSFNQSDEALAKLEAKEGLSSDELQTCSFLRQRLSSLRTGPVPELLTFD